MEETKPKVAIYIENSPMNIQHAVTFKNDVEFADENNVLIYLDRDKAFLAIAMLASILGSTVVIDGETVELTL